MAHEIRRVDYFNATVPDRPGEALRFLSALKDIGVNLVAFTAIPMGLLQTQLTMFPDDATRFEREAHNAGLRVDGPHGALLVQGDDAPGALVGIHERLHEADVNVYASTAVASGQGRYGYIIYLRPEDLARATRAVGS